jgi:hypothetical protein
MASIKDAVNADLSGVRTIQRSQCPASSRSSTYRCESNDSLPIAAVQC